MWLAFRQRIVKFSGFRNPVPAGGSLGDNQTSPYWQAAPAAAVGCSPCSLAVQGEAAGGMLRSSGWERDSCIYVTRRLCWQTVSFAPQLCCSCATSALPTSVCTPSLRFGVPAHSYSLGTWVFSPGLLLKAAQIQPVFIITLSREPDCRVFPEMPVWKKKPGTI